MEKVILGVRSWPAQTDTWRVFKGVKLHGIFKEVILFLQLIAALRIHVT